MKMLCFVLVFFFACGNTNENSSKKVLGTQSSRKGKSGLCVYNVINDNVVRNIFTIDIFSSDTTLIKAVFKIHPDVKIIKEKGIYDDREYLNYVFETSDAYLKVLKKDEGFYIENALVKGDDIKIYNGCFIGIQKKDFFRRLSIGESSCDTVIITDEDQTTCIKFLFSQNRLKEMEVKALE